MAIAEKKQAFIKKAESWLLEYSSDLSDFYLDKGPEPDMALAAEIDLLLDRINNPPIDEDESNLVSHIDYYSDKIDLGRFPVSSFSSKGITFLKPNYLPIPPGGAVNKYITVDAHGNLVFDFVSVAVGNTQELSNGLLGIKVIDGDWFKTTDGWVTYTKIGSGKTNEYVLYKGSHAFSVGDIINNLEVKAKADSKVNAEVKGVITNVISTNRVIVTTGGTINVNGWLDEAGSPLQINTTYSLSASVAGKLMVGTTTVEGAIDKPLLIIPSSLEYATFVNFKGSEVKNPITGDNLAALRSAKTRSAFTTLGYNTPGDGGGMLFNWDSGSTLADNSSTIITPTGHIGSGRWIADFDILDSRAWGIFPDGATNWHTNGRLPDYLKYLSQNKAIGFFSAGDYACLLDNFSSDVTIHFQKGAFFFGTIHAAINPDIAQPTLSRPQRVRFLGDVGSYQRVGTYNCDDVYIERIYIKEDITKDIQGFRSAGIHFYNGTKDLRVDEIVVEASERSYGFGVDSNDAANLPNRVSIGKIHVRKSYTNGAYIYGENIFIGELIVDQYGAGDPATDLNLTMSMPGFTGNPTLMRGLAIESGGQVTIGKARIYQNTANTNAAFGFENRSNSSLVTINSIAVRDSISHAIINYGTLKADHVNIRLSGSRGLWNSAGKIIAGEIDCAQNSATSIYIDGGIFEFQRITAATDATAGILFIGGCTLRGGSIFTQNTNNGGTSQAQIVFAGAKGSVESVTTETLSGTETAGVIMTTAQTHRLKIGHLKTTSGGSTANSRAALQIETAKNFIIQSFEIEKSVYGCTRLLGPPTQYYMQNGLIDTTFGATSGIATVVGVHTNANWHNVVNQGTTNIAATAVNVSGVAVNVTA